MAKDPVCGMEVSPEKAAAKSQHGGNTVYFCSTGCKEKFDREPGKFTGTSTTAPERKPSHK